MSDPFLKDGGQFVIKGGAFVLSDDPAACECCECGCPCDTLEEWDRFWCSCEDNDEDPLCDFYDPGAPECASGLSCRYLVTFDWDRRCISNDDEDFGSYSDEYVVELTECDWISEGAPDNIVGSIHQVASPCGWRLFIDGGPNSSNEAFKAGGMSPAGTYEAEDPECDASEDRLGIENVQIAEITS